MPLHVKRASEFLSKYVGETEKNIARTFYEAEKTHAILVLEEADSFIPYRWNISTSWGISQLNEFIVSLELNRGLCICTTNRRKSLDSAVMRRFGLKVEFLYAKPDQLKLLYNKILAPLAEEKIPKKLEEKLCFQKFLCAGDFQTVKWQFLFRKKGRISHGQLVDALIMEEKLKLEERSGLIGFAV